jgi:hypothetical protein
MSNDLGGWMSGDGTGAGTDGAARGPDRYFLRAPGTGWHEASLAEFVSAEQSAGFHRKIPGYGPATGGFSSSGRQGRVLAPVHGPDAYDDDPEFAAVAFPGHVPD